MASVIRVGIIPMTLPATKKTKKKNTPTGKASYSTEHHPLPKSSHQ
jgi:hypothetical protein